MLLAPEPTTNSTFWQLVTTLHSSPLYVDCSIHKHKRRILRFRLILEFVRRQFPSIFKTAISINSGLLFVLNITFTERRKLYKPYFVVPHFISSFRIFDPELLKSLGESYAIGRTYHDGQSILNMTNRHSFML